MCSLTPKGVGTNASYRLEKVDEASVRALKTNMSQSALCVTSLEGCTEVELAKKKAQAAKAKKAAALKKKEEAAKAKKAKKGRKRPIFSFKPREQLF